MKVSCIIALFLLILCTQSITSSCFEGFPTLKSQDFKLGERLQLHGVNVTNMNIGYADTGERREIEGKNELFDYSRKAQGRKGAYGGGNMAHRSRSSQKNAASPSFFISTLASILLLPFLLTIF